MSRFLAKTLPATTSEPYLIIRFQSPPLRVRSCRHRPSPQFNPSTLSRLSPAHLPSPSSSSGQISFLPLRSTSERLPSQRRGRIPHSYRQPSPVLSSPLPEPSRSRSPIPEFLA